MCVTSVTDVYIVNAVPCYLNTKLNCDNLESVLLLDTSVELHTPFRN